MNDNNNNSALTRPASITLVKGGGGSGTTTLAVAIAVQAAKQGKRVIVFSHNSLDCHDIAGGQVEGVQFVDDPDTKRDADLIIFDGIEDQMLGRFGSLRVGVTKLCYSSLHRLMRAGNIDAMVVLQEPGRALSIRDASNVVGAQVIAVIDSDPYVSRCIDAGLLALRMPQSLVGAANAVLGDHKVVFAS